MTCLPLPLIILLVLMSILSDFSIDAQLSYAYCLHGVSFFPFTLNLFIALYLKCISLRQHIVGSCWDAAAFSQHSCCILILQPFLCSYTSEGLSPHSCSSPSSDCFFFFFFLMEFLFFFFFFFFFKGIPFIFIIYLFI